MRFPSPIAPGRVDWTGDNPGILLREPGDGPFTAMALFFRVHWSPEGPGRVLLLYADPASSRPSPETANVLVSDNRALADYLRESFVGRLKAFREAPAFDGLTHLAAMYFRSTGDPMGRRYAETIVAPGLAVELVWEDLEPPRAIELRPDLTGTGIHSMSSVLVPARAAQIIVNGCPLPGRPGTRVQAGLTTTTAFLYFSETWVLPDGA